MPYTKTPTSDTYSQEDILLSRELVSRQNDPLGTKDENLLNVVIEVVKNRQLQDSRTYHFKRSGTEKYITAPITGKVRGSYFWKDTNLFVYCIGTNVYLYNIVTLSTTTCSSVFTTSTGKVGFVPFLYDTGIVKMVGCDGTDIVTIDSTGVVETSSSPDKPTSHIPQPVFLNGYLFLLKPNTADIINSDLNNPLTFTAGNVFNAEASPDYATGITKINNYLLVFGTSSIEYFWDAGISSGSPLKRNDTPIKYNGLASNIVQSGNTIYFFGYDDNKQINIFQLKDFLIESIASETVLRSINSLESSVGSFSGHMISCLGHDLFMANLGSKSFIYDLKEKLWVTWSWKNTTSFNISDSETLVLPTGNKTVFTIGDENIWYIFNDKKYQDDGTNFSMITITEPADFGTLNRKVMFRFALVCDRPISNSNIAVYVSDDDYTSWYGGWEINLDQDMPSISGGLGSFRQRAFKLVYTDNHPLRIQKIQVDINKGRN